MLSWQKQTRIMRKYTIYSFPVCNDNSKNINNNDNDNNNNNDKKEKRKKLNLIVTRSDWSSWTQF